MPLTEGVAMNVFLIKTSLCIFLLVLGCGVESATKRPIELKYVPQDAQLGKKGISKEEAIASATQDALKTYDSLAQFNIVTCEQQIFWRIIFDGGGPEYVIDKTSGAIRRRQRIPQESVGGENETTYVNAPGEVDREQAIAIAKRDASQSVPGEDMEKFTISACELNKVWRVFVEFKLYPEQGTDRTIIPHASTPNYVIDKKTSKIIFKQRYGSPGENQSVSNVNRL